MEWVAVVIAVVVLIVGVRYVIGKMQGAAQEYRDALIRDEIENTKAWLEQQRHG